MRARPKSRAAENAEYADKRVKSSPLIAKAELAKMKEILNTLGIKVLIKDLPADVAAMADIINRTIMFSQGELTADNLTEEVCGNQSPRAI